MTLASVLSSCNVVLKAERKIVRMTAEVDTKKAVRIEKCDESQALEARTEESGGAGAAGAAAAASAADTECAAQATVIKNLETELDGIKKQLSSDKLGIAAAISAAVQAAESETKQMAVGAAVADVANPVHPSDLAAMHGDDEHHSHEDTARTVASPSSISKATAGAVESVFSDSHPVSVEEGVGVEYMDPFNDGGAQTGGFGPSSSSAALGQPENNKLGLVQTLTFEMPGEGEMVDSGRW